MTKVINEQQVATASTIGSSLKWYKTSDVVYINNTGQTDVRLDKLLLQVSVYNSFAVGPGVCGVIVHITDEAGNSLNSSIVDGTTTDALLTALLNQWKDNVFMTDFRFMGLGSTTQDGMNVIPLEANTRRILKPGQKLCVMCLAQPLNAETTKSCNFYLDAMWWYSAAAQ